MKENKINIEIKDENLYEKVIEEDLMYSLEFCDLVVEDEISKDCPRCDGYISECDSCETKKFLDSVNYLGLIKKYGGRMRYDLKNWSWVRKNGEEIRNSSKQMLIDD